MTKKAKETLWFIVGFASLFIQLMAVDAHLNYGVTNALYVAVIFGDLFAVAQVMLHKADKE